MNTPIIDAVGNNAKSWPILSAYKHVFDTARRLELDRAALMEALANLERRATFGTVSEEYLNESRLALVAARANFPTE